MSADHLSAAKIDFAFNLLEKLRAGGDENVFCSPVSILGAFAMLLAGAKGQSAKELKSALKLDSVGDAQLHTEVGKFLQSFLHVESEEGQLSLANRAYVQDGLALTDAYVKTLHDAYHADVGKVDFKQADKSCAAINKWVQDQTHGQIKDAISQSAITRETQLILVNTIHFKANWYNRFNEASTENRPFHVAPGKTITVPMMAMDCPMVIAQDDALGCKMLSMTFMDDQRYTMLVILPNKQGGLVELEAKLNGHVMSQLIGKLAEEIVLLQIPKFRVEASIDLGDVMKQLGAGSVFDKGADLSGLSTAGGLHVSKAVHKTFFSINEEGAEATAFSGLSSELTCGFLSAVEFFVNHPFLVAIYDTQTKAIGFIGRITHPKE